MHFIVDAMMPRQLVTWIKVSGHLANHVHGLGLQGTNDSEIWSYACQNQAVVITKDADYVELSRSDNRGMLILYKRGNLTRGALLNNIREEWHELVKRLQSGEKFIILN